MGVFAIGVPQPAPDRLASLQDTSVHVSQAQERAGPNPAHLARLPGVMEVRRDDGELCGHVAPHGSGWRSFAVFGARFAEHETEDEARRHVAAVGLAALADRWTLTDGASGEEQLVCIQEASPLEVTVALGCYALPGVPATTIRAEELTAGRWILEHRS